MSKVVVDGRELEVLVVDVLDLEKGSDPPTVSLRRMKKIKVRKKSEILYR